MRCSWLICVGLLAVSAGALASEGGFRWASPKEDAKVFKDVQKAFANELKPDVYGQTGNTVPLLIKYIERIGLLGQSALVIIGHRENEKDSYPVYRVFTFDLSTRAKTLLESKDRQWFPVWKLVRVAHFESPENPDVVFRYFSCTECEESVLLASFRYVRATKSWEFRHWSDTEGDDLLIGSAVQFGDDGNYSYDCLHTVRDLTRDGLDDVAVRCRERLQAEENGPWKQLKDETLFFSVVNGVLTRVALGSTAGLNHRVHVALCEGRANNPLCRKHSRRTPQASGAGPDRPRP